MEYGNIIWDNCSQKDTELFELVQKDTARIITGRRKGTTRIKKCIWYKELGWDSLQSTRHKNKLLHFHKVSSGEIPRYIAAEIHPPFTNNNTQNNLRHWREYRTPYVVLVLHVIIVLSNDPRKMNSLDHDTKCIASFAKFKSVLHDDIIHGLEYFDIGKRYYNIINCQVRNEAWSFNRHLVTEHMSDSSAQGKLVAILLKMTFISFMFVHSILDTNINVLGVLGSSQILILVSWSMTNHIESDNSLTKNTLQSTFMECYKSLETYMLKTVLWPIKLRMKMGNVSKRQQPDHRADNSWWFYNGLLLQIVTWMESCLIGTYTTSSYIYNLSEPIVPTEGQPYYTKCLWNII